MSITTLVYEPPRLAVCNIMDGYSDNFDLGWQAVIECSWTAIASRFKMAGSGVAFPDLTWALSGSAGSSLLGLLTFSFAPLPLAWFQ